MFDEISIDYRVEKMVIDRVIDMEVLVVIVPAIQDIYKTKIQCYWI